METPNLQTKRMLLKPITLTDAPSYQKHFSDYEVIRNLHVKVPWPFPQDGAEDYIKNHILPKQGKDRWIWGLFLNEHPGELIGGIELWREGTPENRGFWLGRKNWGKGLMTEAVVSVMNFAFFEAGFNKLIFSNPVGNQGSHRIKEKTGATLLRIETGAFVDPAFTQREIWELPKEKWTELSK